MLVDTSELSGIMHQDLHHGLLADVGLANDGVLRQVLHDYFVWATTTTMSRYHQSADDVPNGLSIPHWSWDGLQE